MRTLVLQCCTCLSLIHLFIFDSCVNPAQGQVGIGGASIKTHARRCLSFTLSFCLITKKIILLSPVNCIHFFCHLNHIQRSPCHRGSESKLPQLHYQNFAPLPVYVSCRKKALFAKNCQGQYDSRYQTTKIKQKQKQTNKLKRTNHVFSPALMVLLSCSTVIDLSRGGQKKRKQAVVVM